MARPPETDLGTVAVISLARSLERRARFASLNGHIAYHFVDAVDGTTLTDTDRNDPAVFGARLPYTDGAYGCTLSHLREWRQCIADGRPRTIAEDDAVFRLDFDGQSRRLVESLADDWDLVLWGWNLDFHVTLDFMPDVTVASMRFDALTSAGGSAAFQRRGEAPTAFRLRQAWGVPAYSITPKGAERLMAACVPLQRFEMDVSLTGLRVPNTAQDSAMCRAYAALNAYVPLPPLVFTENDRATSTIQRPTVKKGTLSRGWRVIKTSLKGARRSS